jgi:hypothetical protein
MEAQEIIAITQLCATYKVEISFFNELNEVGLIEIITIKEANYLHQDALTDIEKMIRMHQDLDLNIEGIDVVFNLLNKVDNLQNELNATQNRLSLYEDKIA